MRAAVLCAAATVAILVTAGVSVASSQPYPRLPKMVWELYLPEEYDACGVAYGLYARLPEADRARLHSGTKVTLDPGTLTRDQRRALAAWFNSARWGCDPPAEQLDGDGVRGSTVVLKCEDEVVEFCLQSPQEKIWRKLTIASAPERAEWVRDGLPLFPHWCRPAGWDGGPLPPSPTISTDEMKYRQLSGKATGRDPAPGLACFRTDIETGWELLHAHYPLYAELAPERLRELHRERELRIPFGDLTPKRQSSLVGSVDDLRLFLNRAFHQPLDKLRPPDARARHFGITHLQFEYRRHLDGGFLTGMGELAGPNCDPCPRPFRRIFLTVATPYPPTEGGWSSHAFTLALPPELQRSLIAYSRALSAWLVQWTDFESPTGGHRPNAPPQPKHPPG